MAAGASTRFAQHDDFGIFRSQSATGFECSWNPARRSGGAEIIPPENLMSMSEKPSASAEIAVHGCAEPRKQYGRNEPGCVPGRIDRFDRELDIPRRAGQRLAGKRRRSPVAVGRDCQLRSTLIHPEQCLLDSSDQSSSPRPFNILCTCFSTRAARVTDCFAPAKCKQ